MALMVDLNCDLGEGAGHDAALMPLITSANIACGAHAGDAATMRETVARAAAAGVALGAHPGFADRGNFGRREFPISPREAGDLVRRQVEGLREIAGAQGREVTHVKLHGALYNQVARDRALAEGVLDAVWSEAWRPWVVVLAGSVFERAARERGVGKVAAEVFADRGYRADGSLVPRGLPGALLDDEREAVAQVMRMVREGVVRAVEGGDVALRAETVCLHGDGPNPVEFAGRLREALAAAGIPVRAFSR